MSTDSTTPVETTEPVEPDNGIPAEPAPIHPAWEQALAVVPESLRGGIYEQIRNTERENQKAIETARQNSIDPQWREFAEAAKQNSINPEQLVEAYNVSQQLAADPIGFQQRLNQEIDAAVASGQLTRAEGQQAKATVQAEVDDSLDGLETPEAAKIRELQAQIEGISGQLTAQQQAEYDYQQQVAADQYMRNFEQTVDDIFVNNGIPNVAVDTKIAIMRMADSALDGDPSGTLTVESAVQGAFNALIAFRNQQVGTPAAPQQQQQPLPIGGASGTPATPAPQKWDNTPAGKAAREAAMMAEARRVLAE